MKKLRFLTLILTMLFVFVGCSNEAFSMENTLSNSSALGTTTSSTKKLSNLKVHYIDVGQGDSQLLQTNGINILIDTGEADQSENLIAYLESQGVQTIDYLFLTHPHTDHMGAATAVMEHFPVKQVYLTNRTHTTAAYRKLIETIQKKKIKRVQAKAGVSINFTKNLHGTILSPSKNYDDINASSIVMKITYGTTSFLFNGDATVETESDILNAGYDVSATVYKVAHHGSSSSNSTKFLQAVNPSLCIIQLGKNNSYGHPHKEVKERLKKLGVPVYRTDEDGTIVVTTNGKKLSVKTKKTNSATISTSPSTTTPSTGNSKATYIGNKNSKVFHLPTCSSLPNKKNQVTFTSRSAAIQSGYHACSRCNP